MSTNVSLRPYLWGATAVSLLAIALLLSPVQAAADVFTFGSPLSVPATLNTTDNLSYEGVNTPLPGVIVHTSHFGADTAIWNGSLAQGSATAPADGQALKVRLEGCAVQPEGAAAPLTQIHLQSITPLEGGGAHVNLTSQPYEIPVCGENGASGSTVSTYEPVNLCVAEGDTVAFNDEGGFAEPYYRAGVAYEVLGSVDGSTAYSFIRPGGTDNGATMSSDYRTAMEGFATNGNEELMLQVEEGTGADATHICPGGTAGLPPVLAPVRIDRQTEGVNNKRLVPIAIYCRRKPRCSGTMTIRFRGRTIGQATIALSPQTTSHVPIRITEQAYGIAKRKRILTTLSAVVEGQTVAQAVTIL